MNPESFRRIRALYDELHERPEDEKRRALAELDLEEEVRAELEALLEYEPATHVFDEENLGRVGRALVDEAPETELPERIGPYCVLRKLGEGGMGVVYACEHVDSQVTAAVKVVRPGFSGPGLVRRFAREARVLARLRHPGIAAFLEWGEARLQSGVDSVTLPFLAMEYVDGEPLLHHAKNHGLDDGARVELMARVCEAVHHAHELGIVHRDIKPGNILVERGRQGQAGVPKVLDFGVARVTEVDVHTLSLTNSGAILGTVPYMSPEQVCGTNAAVDRRSDVYSLGVVLFELLADRLPYDVRGRPILEAARIIQEEEPTRLGSVVERLRGDLEVVVSKALEKERARRYPTAQALALDLRRFLRGEPIAARPATWSHQVAKFARRHKALVGTLCGTIAALVVGLVTALSFAIGEREARLEAVRLTYRTAVDGAATDLSSGEIEAARRRLAQAPAELRGWEWELLNSRLDVAVYRSTHLPVVGRPTSLAFTEDGRGIQAVFHDQGRSRADVYTWRLDEDGYELRTLEHVGSACVGPRGRFLYWVDLETRTLEVERLGERVVSYELGTDLDRVVVPSTSLERVVFLDGKEKAAWIDLTDTSPRRKSDLQAGAKAELSADGFRLAWARQGNLFAADADTLRETLVAPIDYGRPIALALSPDGDRVATTRGPTVEVRALDSDPVGELLTTFDGHRDEIVQMTFSHDGALVASAAEDSVVRVWDAAAGIERASFPCSWTPHMALAFSSDGTLLAALRSDGDVDLRELHVWSTAGVGDVVSVGERVRGAVFNANGQRLLVSTAAGHLVVLDAATGFEIGRYIAPKEFRYFYSAATTPDDRWVAIGARDPSGSGAFVRLLDAETGEVRTLATTNPSAPNVRIGLAIAPDDGRLAACLRTGEVFVWQPGTWNEIRREQVGLDCAVAIAFDSSGDLLAVGGLDGRIVLLDGRDLSPRGELQGHTDSVWALDFHPDGSRLASSSADGTVRSWDLANLGSFVECARAKEAFFTLAHSPDGTRLVVGGADRLVRILDCDDYGPIACLPDHRDAVRAVAFSPDGRCLATGSGDGTVRLWSLVPADRRYRERIAYRETQRRLQPRVDEWIASYGPRGASERLRADADLSGREREIGLQLVLHRVLE